ncbi:MAG: radical SAM protein [Candidatus Bathyarchaeia archaeon]
MNPKSLVNPQQNCARALSRMAATQKTPKKIRVSLGSAIVLKLLNGKLDAAPTTAYLMTYRRDKCTANCGFCPQARESKGRADMLSRVSWPVFSTEKVIHGIEEAVKRGEIRRVCFQTLNYPEAFTHLTALIKAVHKKTDVPISVSCQPLNSENIKAMADAGAERIGIPLDAATPELFDKIKGLSARGPYNWVRQFELLSEAVTIFGKGKVSTHLIVGLGETEKEMVSIIQKCVDMGVLPALFAFTPITGTTMQNMSQPPIQKYRRIQIARHLIVNGVGRYENMHFDSAGHLTNFGINNQTLEHILKTSEPYLTSGCPDCNRPYYNEKPGGTIYNYPKKPTEKQLAIIQEELGLAGSLRSPMP